MYKATSKLCELSRQVVFQDGEPGRFALVRLPRSVYTGSTVQLQLLSTALGFLEAYFHILGCLWLKNSDDLW